MCKSHRDTRTGDRDAPNDDAHNDSQTLPLDAAHPSGEDTTDDGTGRD
ncbi:Uncharacterised protein [Mycobacteroides abscessus subsp. abscessus]|nr:Uncharacterised protein [Mycobacteroides abscessus subsp. abscessus]